jgi:hypothetical protein
MPTADQKPSEKFRNAIQQILAVPKKELTRREAEYKKQRKTEKKRHS